MAKPRHQPKGNQQPPPPQPGVNAVGFATLAAVVIVLVVSVLNLRAVQRIQTEFDDKLGRVEDRIAQVSSKISSQPAQAAQPAATPPRRGPDPNRVYPIKTAGRPAKGPTSAPVTIAEFSDFQ